jgi:putative ABC transport system permease protein
MLRSYLKIALRNLSRNRVFSLINIVGLGLGLASCMLILLYTRDELSFDRFQKNAGNLYRITCQIIDPNLGSGHTTLGLSGMVEGPAFKRTIPEVLTFTRTNETSFIVRRGTESFNQRATWVDKNFFSVFSFPLLSGNPRTVLSDPHSVVLTDEMARKYFGTTDAVGKTLEFEIDTTFETFKVSGIARRSPANSSIGFDILLPFEFLDKKHFDDGWLYFSFSTYLLLQPGADAGAVAGKMQNVYENESAAQRREAAKQGFNGIFHWGLQPLLQMHLDDSVEQMGIREASKPIYSYILTGIALFILTIACINFINLTMAQSLKRSKEIGLRKVVGGSRAQLVRQFLGESFVLCGIAFLLGVILAISALPFFNDMANKRLSLSYLLDGPLVALGIGLFLVTGFVAGFYPSLVLSRFRPVESLYNRATRLSGKNFFGKGLVVLQFALSTFLIIGTLFLYSQYNYLTHADLGYNDRDLLSVTVTGQGGNAGLMSVFKSEFTRIPGIRAVGMHQEGGWGTVAKAAGKEIGIQYEHIDAGYLRAMGITLVAGRNFSPAFPSDSMQSVIINEAFAKAAGWKQPLGRTIDFLNGQNTRLTVVGVVKDYHYGSMKEKIGPQLFSITKGMGYGVFLLRINPASAAHTLAAVEATYRRLFPWHPFEHDFAAEENELNYVQEARWKQIITAAAVLAIFISCIGLLGLSLLSIRQRTKEIGVRKVLGAGTWQIAGLVSKNFVGLIVLAFLVSVPAAWWAVGKWLANFPYQVPMSAWVFLAGAGLTLVIAVLTVGSQAVRAASANPVNSLRTE